MIYKYLTNKLEQSHGCFIKKLTVIAMEICNENAQKEGIIEEFLEEDIEEICQILDFNSKEETYNYIKSSIQEESFISMLIENNRDGFLAKVYFPICYNFQYNDKQEIDGYLINNGRCETKWIYSHTLGELVEKILIESETKFLTWTERERV
jgi:hypothetical protein